MDKNLNNVNDALKRFLERNKKKALEEARPEMMQEMSQNVMKAFEPVISNLSENSKLNQEDLKAALQAIQIQSPQVNIPEIKIPEFKIPEPKVTVNVPKAERPVVNVPPPIVNFPESMAIHGIDYKSPMPVRLVDLKGKPYESIGGGSSGPGFPMDVLDRTSANPAVRVTGTFSVTASNTSTQAIDSSGEAYSVANPMPVQVVSGGTATTAVQNLNADGTYRDTFPVQGTVLVSDITASIKATLIDSTGVGYSGSNPVPVSGSVAVSGVTNSIGATILNGEGVARDSWGSSQVGTWNIGTVASITASTGVSLLGSDGLAFGTSKPVPVTMVTGVSTSVIANLHDSSGVGYDGSNPMWVRVSSAGNTTGTNIHDSSGIGYSGSNPLPVTFVTGVSASVNASIIDSSGVGYSGSNPVPVSMVSGANDTIATLPFEVATTNRTSKTDGADVRPKADPQGRQLTRMQSRGLLATAYASFTTGTEGTLLAGTAGVYNDLIYILASNNSTVAVGIDVRAVSAGNILLHLEIPPNSTTGLAAPAPFFGAITDQSGNNWTVDLPDITGTTVYVSALFSKEVV